MEIIKKISALKQSLEETDEMVDQIISSLETQYLKSEKKENQISRLKEEIEINIKKIDAIIENYNAKI
tara:strand:- start:81 stop:284 length:204 start_codon:yes stop_codon:yes gene_type:complete